MPKNSKEKALAEVRRAQSSFERTQSQLGRDSEARRTSFERARKTGATLREIGEPHQKIVVACARELAGFVWAIATEQPLHTA